jgi:S-adenosylmethionine synthetase
LLCLSEYLKCSGLAGINVTVVLGEKIEPIKIVFEGIVTGSHLGQLGLPLEPLLISMASMFLSASLEHL